MWRNYTFFIISEQLLISLNTKMSATIPMEATDLCFSVLFIILFKVVLIFESVDEILKCDHSNESYWVVISFGTVYYGVQVGSQLLSLRIKC